MSDRTEKEELGEELLQMLITNFVNNILHIESESDGELFFDNVSIDADLKDGRNLKLRLEKDKV